MANYKWFLCQCPSKFCHGSVLVLILGFTQTTQDLNLWVFGMGPKWLLSLLFFLDFLCDYSIVYFLFSVCLMCMNWMVGKRTIATPLNWSASLILWHGWQVTNSWRLFLHYQVNIVLASWKNGNKIANIKKILDIYIIYFYFLLVLLFCQPGFFISVFY